MSLSRGFPSETHGLEKDADRRERFRRLVNQWHEETAGQSSPTRIVNNPAYQEIISWGRAALPLILEELRESGGYWYPALRAITGENPMPDYARGKPKLIAEAWLEWGRQHKRLQ